MSDTQQAEPLVSDDAISERVNNMAWRANGSAYAGMMLGMKSIRYDYEAELATLQQENARLAAEVAARNEKLLSLTANPKSLEAKVLGYQDVAEEWQRITAQAIERMEAAEAELAALRAEARWEPVESGEVYFDFYIGTTADRRVRIRKTDALGKITNDFVTLPDNWNVCRLVPGRDTPAQEGSDE